MELLKSLNQLYNHPWVVIGDFNEILYFNEILSQNGKQGGHLHEERAMMAFQEVFNECGLLDMRYHDC